MTKEELEPYDESVTKYLQGLPVNQYDKLNMGSCYEMGYKVQLGPKTGSGRTLNTVVTRFAFLTRF